MQKLLLICCVIGSYACRQQSHNTALISSQIDSTLEQTIDIIAKHNSELFLELQRKSYERCSQIEGTEGLYFSGTLKQVSDTLLMRIKEMEDDLREDAILERVSVVDFFIKKGNGDKLRKSIRDYKHGLLQIDSLRIKEYAGGDISKWPESIIVDGIDLHDAFIQLSNLKAQVYLVQNKMMRYFVMRTNVLCCGMKSVSEFLVTQNSNIVFAGDKLEITAGIVAFQWQAQPTVSINNKQVEVSSGRAVHQMKVPDLPGEYDVPVTIQYNDQKTGAIKTQMTKVHYTVIKKDK
jgi:hypothetical protein